MGLESLSTLMFNGSPNDMPSGVSGNVGSNTMGSDPQSMTSSSSGRGTLSPSTQKLLGDADKVIAEFGKKYDVQLQQGQGSHGDRVVNAHRIYEKLKSDPEAAKEFLAQMGKIGKPLGLNFGLHELEGKGGAGQALNADAAKSLKGEQRTEHDKLYSQWQQDRKATEGGNQGSNQGTPQGKTQGMQEQQPGQRSMNSNSNAMSPERGGPQRQQQQQSSQQQQSNRLGNLLNNVASLNRNGNPDKIGLQEVQRALSSPGLQSGEKQALTQLGKAIQQHGGQPVSVQQAMSLLGGSRGSSAGLNNDGRNNGAGLSSMRQQGGWPNISRLPIDRFVRAINTDHNGNISPTEMWRAMDNPSLPSGGRQVLERLLGMSSDRPTSVPTMTSFLGRLQAQQRAQDSPALR
jgi:hypothetical protein